MAVIPPQIFLFSIEITGRIAIGVLEALKSSEV